MPAPYAFYPKAPLVSLRLTPPVVSRQRTKSPSPCPARRLFLSEQGTVRCARKGMWTATHWPFCTHATLKLLPPFLAGAAAFYCDRRARIA